MLLSARHIILLAGMIAVLISFLFFGRQHELYQLLSLSGMLICTVSFLWIIYIEKTIKEKLQWAGIVALGIILSWAIERLFINASYRIYLLQHRERLAAVNDLLKSRPGEVSVIHDSVREKGAPTISLAERNMLLQAKKKLGVYMIYKTDSTIYYGLWGFLDVRIGLTFKIQGDLSNNPSVHPTNTWFQ